MSVPGWHGWPGFDHLVEEQRFPPWISPPTFTSFVKFPHGVRCLTGIFDALEVLRGKRIALQVSGGEGARAWSARVGDGNSGCSGEGSPGVWGARGGGTQ